MGWLKTETMSFFPISEQIEEDSLQVLTQSDVKDMRKLDLNFITMTNYDESFEVKNIYDKVILMIL